MCLGEIGVIESFGEFSHIARAGFTCILWPMQDIVSLQSLRVQQVLVFSLLCFWMSCWAESEGSHVLSLTCVFVPQLDVLTESKTKDDVTVMVKVAVQYQVGIRSRFAGDNNSVANLFSGDLRLDGRRYILCEFEDHP